LFTASERVKKFPVDLDIYKSKDNRETVAKPQVNNCCDISFVQDLIVECQNDINSISVIHQTRNDQILLYWVTTNFHSL